MQGKKIEGTGERDPYTNTTPPRCWMLEVDEKDMELLILALKILYRETQATGFKAIDDLIQARLKEIDNMLKWLEGMRGKGITGIRSEKWDKE